MTREDKAKLLLDYCGQFADCGDCPLCESGHCNSDTIINNLPDSQLDEMLVIADLVPQPIEDIPVEHNVITHPDHYCHGGMECIDEMLTLFGKQAVMHFCLLNAWKYRKRMMYKNGQEDMDKSDWYIAKYKELSEL